MTSERLQPKLSISFLLSSAPGKQLQLVSGYR